MTSCDTFRSRIVRAAAAAAGLTAALYILTPQNWFSFYGWAVVLLAAVVLFTPPLWQRLQDLGQRRMWALLFAVPAVLIGAVQIGFWLAFFLFGPTNPTPGVLRTLFWMNAGPFVPYAAAVLGLTWIALFWGAGRQQP